MIKRTIYYIFVYEICNKSPLKSKISLEKISYLIQKFCVFYRYKRVGIQFLLTCKQSPNVSNSI